MRNIKENFLSVFVILLVLALAIVWYFDNKSKIVPLIPVSSSPLPFLSVPKLPFPVAQANYICDSGKTIKADFYEGETIPIEPGEMPIPTGKVKIILDNGRSFILPQTISASGVRYANGDESFIFWIKGDTALILENNIEKDYKGCVVSAEEGITIISPNGGEAWSKGQKVQISWSAAKEIRSVNIRLVISENEESQSFNAAIVFNVPNTGNYEWVVQELFAEVWGIKALPPSDRYIIVVEDSERNDVYDVSDLTFSIN